MIGDYISVYKTTFFLFCILTCSYSVSNKLFQFFIQNYFYRARYSSSWLCNCAISFLLNFILLIVACFLNLWRTFWILISAQWDNLHTSWVFCCGQKVIVAAEKVELISLAQISCPLLKPISIICTKDSSSSCLFFLLWVAVYKQQKLTVMNQCSFRFFHWLRVIISATCSLSTVHKSMFEIPSS